MSEWKPFVDQVGRSVPFASGLQDLAVKAEWYARARPILDEYARLWTEEMQRRGFTVSVDYSMATHFYASPTGWGYGGTVERAGLAVRFLIQELYPVRWTPVEFADFVESQWMAERARRLRGETLPYSEATVTDAGALSGWTPPAITPGPGPTAPTSANTQQEQAPPTPDVGTLTSTDTELPNQMYSFDQWNYLYQQETGRPGPAPEQVGFPVERRSEPISRAEWVQYAMPWIQSAGAAGAGGGAVGGGGAAGGAGSRAAPAEYLSLVAALLAWIGLLRQ